MNKHTRFSGRLAMPTAACFSLLPLPQDCIPPRAGRGAFCSGRSASRTTTTAISPWRRANIGNFRRTASLLSGQSDPRRDWPYVHPGPDDTWAGARPHTFTIVFALRAAPAGGDCGLLLALVDTHRGAPPVLDVTVNGRNFRQKLPTGAGDASISGRPEQGRGPPLCP